MLINKSNFVKHRLPNACINKIYLKNGCPMSVVSDINYL